MGRACLHLFQGRSNSNVEMLTTHNETLADRALPANIFLWLTHSRCFVIVAPVVHFGATVMERTHDSASRIGGPPLRDRSFP